MNLNIHKKINKYICCMNFNFLKQIKNPFKIKESIIYANSLELSIDDYIQNRYKDQLCWYEKYARNCRIYYYILLFFIIVIGSSIPIINIFSSGNYNSYDIKIASAIPGSLIVIITGILQITKWQENGYHIDQLQNY